jgi:hypothetical protein
LQACTPGKVAGILGAEFHKEKLMTISLTPLLSLIAGILVLLVPRLLNYIVAFYLIIVGVVGLFGSSINITP